MYVSIDSFSVVADSMPLVHVIWGVHINKSRLVLCRSLAASTELWEARSCSLLYIISPRSSFKALSLTFESRSSVATLQTSWYFTTSHATLSSKSFTCDTGSVARRWAYSAGGSRAEARWNGNLGGSVDIVDGLGLSFFCEDDAVLRSDSFKTQYHRIL